jgi:hypothetical protein
MSLELDLFHHCALWAYAEAMAEGRHVDAEYVRRLAYKYYEEELRCKKSKLANAD